MAVHCEQVRVDWVITRIFFDPVTVTPIEGNRALLFCSFNPNSIDYSKKINNLLKFVFHLSLLKNYCVISEYKVSRLTLYFQPIGAYQHIKTCLPQQDCQLFVNVCYRLKIFIKGAPSKYSRMPSWTSN